MSQKRQQPEEGSSFDEKRPRRLKSFKSVVLEVMNMCKFQRLLAPVLEPVLEQLLEPIIRRAVKEEVDTAIRKYIINMKRNCGKDAHSSEVRSLCLQFGSPISLPVFTGTRIEGVGCAQLEVALIDLLTGEVVSSGLGSSAKVEIVVLEGDFDLDGRDDWTLAEFENNTVREREGKKPLLNGDLIMTLQDGKGLVSNVIFTDNSSWTRSRKFRLGARLLDSIGGNNRVREARSEPFVVRDHRGELYKKHHPPSLSDEVWRLEKISKDGAFHKRLRQASVNTVEDFLMSLSCDSTRLRNILGAGMSAKMWEVTVEHARTCVIDQKSYFYGVSQNKGVVFNIVGQVVGSISNGQYLDADKLSEAEKTEAHELVIAAFADREKIVSFDDDSSPNFPTSSKSLSIAQSSSNLLSGASFHDDISSSQKIDGSSYLQQNASSPDYMQSMYSVEGLSSFEDCLHHADSVEIRCDQQLNYPGQVRDSLLCNTDTLDQTFCEDELQYFEGDCAIQTPHLELSADIQGAIAAYIPCSDISMDKAQRGWKVLVFVLRWWFWIKRRLVARKTGT